ncbi:uncharacterized protein BJ171DRAFT_566075 [Polychytrium aggregatum]|uniref:uncharacterized protein n=1 Tax=Polychytrium aggregatum TaxID=110093 RepID=UPI0022FE2F08|nr:uncharacterized protein BJ171DRAFT_566075 [Polychytrium aggregatum]KAI9207261.1 hypothetical protein BJ171DRAFT_566075 [Polychytrium aggregatum]
MTNSDVDSMLSALSGGTMSYGDVACNWLQNNEIVWKTWIPSPPVLDVASCGVGMGKYSIGLMTECLSCPVGSYNWQANNTGTCTLCPTNANCAGGTLVVPSENYWLNSLSTTVADIYECPVDGVCCPGGACNITNQCAPGFAGVLCSDCASPEHYMWGGAGPTIEILTFYFQVASLITDRFGIHQVLSVISLNMDVLPKCLVPLSGMFKILFIYASPALMFMNLSWVLGLCWLFSKFAPMRAVEVISKRAPAYLKHHSLAENAIHTSVEVATFCFLPMIEAATTLLDCRTIAGTNVLYQAASTPCWKGMHLGAGIFAIIVITTLLGAVPVSLLVYLRSLKVKRQLVYVTHDTTWHRLLYKPFRKKYYFWLPVALFERGFVLLIFVAFSGTDKFTMNNSRVFLFFVLSIVRMYIQPYRQHAESRLNQEACLCWLVLSSLNYLYLFNWTTNGAVALLDAAMVVVLLLPIVSFVYWRSHRVVQRMKSKGLADDRSAGSHNCLSDDAIATIPSKVRKSQNIEGEA